jgi:putative ATPase
LKHNHANLPPLAERVRPQNLKDFAGQRSLLSKNSLISTAIQNGNLFSMILWGPPGSGKTTLAKIISRSCNYSYYELSAVSSGVKDLRKILAIGKEQTLLNKPVLLFIDEIHRYSKSQQDSLLHGVEQGIVTLIGATTENPSFEVISPLLSRCRVLTLAEHSIEELNTILNHAIKTDDTINQMNVNIELKAKNLLLKSSGGDARKMLNTFELALSFLNNKNNTCTEEHIQNALQNKMVLYDKDGDYHYDVISAFIKSVRGSDPDASIYWLAVMLEGGEKPEFIARRLIILASEDIGNAEPYAISLANATFDAVHKIGMPEASYVLSQTTTYLASVPKSNASAKAIITAREYIKKNGRGSVPLHLRNSATDLMENLDYGKNYKYPHSFPEGFVKENYFPKELTDKPQFYHPKELGREKFLRERLEYLKKLSETGD